MAKKVMKVFKIQLEAGKATPAPPVGSTLGPTGVNIMNVCTEYNNKTKDHPGMIMPAEITIYEDRSFSMVIKTPPASALLKSAASVEKGSSAPHKVKVSAVSKKQIEEIAKIKIVDMNANSIDSAMKTIQGTARSMGIEVKEEE